MSCGRIKCNYRKSQYFFLFIYYTCANASNRKYMHARATDATNSCLWLCFKYHLFIFYDFLLHSYVTLELKWKIKHFSNNYRFFLNITIPNPRACWIHEAERRSKWETLGYGTENWLCAGKRTQWKWKVTTACIWMHQQTAYIKQID